MQRANLILSLLLAGCANGALDGNGDDPDLAVDGIDLATPPPDLATPVDGTTIMCLPTGAPCQANADCCGKKPQCLKKDSGGHAWPDGYCTSVCNPAKNDPSIGDDPECPGFGTCGGYGNLGTCYTLCSEMTGMTPCERMGYSCFAAPFGACMPTSLSECDPQMAGTCGMARTCVQIGYDPVGECFPGCDVFAQDCMPIQGQDAGCYPSYYTGEGFCAPVYAPHVDGEACMYLTDCAAGLTCAFTGGPMGVCRPYCGGPNLLQCSNGKRCVPLTFGIPTKVVGICNG